MSFDFGISLAIVLGVYLVSEGLKLTVLKTNEKRKILPVICGGLGLAAGVGCYIADANLGTSILGDSNIGDAVACGMASGLSAVGANQIKKQLGITSTDTGITDDTSNTSASS